MYGKQIILKQQFITDSIKKLLRNSNVVYESGEQVTLGKGANFDQHSHTF